MDLLECYSHLYVQFLNIVEVIYTYKFGFLQVIFEHFVDTFVHFKVRSHCDDNDNAKSFYFFCQK